MGKMPEAPVPSYAWRLASALHSHPCGSTKRTLSKAAGKHLFKEGETAMENTIGIAVVAGAIFVSFAVALGLEWASLVLLMKMMPARSTSQMVAPRVSPVSKVRERNQQHRQAA
jgi:hypothetical protein